MRILVSGSSSQLAELKKEDSGIEWIHAEDPAAFISTENIDAYFNLREDAVENDYSSFEKPVFIHSVHSTFRSAGNVIRINGWNGFLQRNTWEVTGDISNKAMAILSAMKKNPVPVPDEPGFISARVIAMIINEAYFAKEEAISSEEDIDTAMKLGTNYPFGPFEWAELIGIHNIYALLKTLEGSDKRYRPSLLLEQEAITK